MNEQTLFYDAIYPYVVEAMIAEGIDPKWAPITAAQMMIESSWGKSELAKLHNYFGMKATKDQAGKVFKTREGYGENARTKESKFRTFESREEGIRQGVARLKNFFRAYEGTPSAAQYVKNINRNPKLPYFTGDPANYVKNLYSISNSKAAKYAINNYTENEARREKEKWDNYAQEQLVEHPDAVTVANPYSIPVEETIAKPIYVTFTPDNYVEAEEVEPEEWQQNNAMAAWREYERIKNFRNAMKWENQEPKRYFPTSGINYVVDSYAEGGKLDRKKLWDELSMKEKADMIRVAVKNGITTLPEIREKYNEFAMGGDTEEIEGRVLPEVTVTPDSMTLYTWRPLVDSEFKFTGHSELMGHPVVTDNGRVWVSNRPGWGTHYNLVTNNCSDATRRALERISGKRINPVLFTTPGDVKDFAEQELGGVTHYRNGRYETRIPISIADRRALSEDANKFDEPDYEYFLDNLINDNNRALGVHIYDGITENSQQMETYEAPWVTEAKEREIIRRNWLEEQAEKYAQAVEDARHPTGHYMNELIVTPNGSSIGSVSSDAMLDNLLSSTRERQAKDRRDASNMVKHIHEGTDTAAKALYPLVAAPAAPYLYSGVTGLMANPYTDALLTSAGGAHAIQSLTDGKADAFTALEILPMARLAKPIANTAISAYTSLVDKYPGIEQYPRYAIGKFKYGFDTELPTLYRKIDKVPNIQNGKVNVSSPNNRFAYDNGFGEESPIITNMTTDAPVRSHSDGDWDRKLTLAFSGKNLLGKHVVSTRPSDTFIVGDNLTVPVKDVTAISGRAKEVNALNNNGIKTISSPEVEAFWESGVEDYIDKAAKYRKDYTNWINTNGIRLNKLQEPIDNFSNYARSVEDLTRESFKSPTLKDYQFMDYVFKPKYKSQVSPVVEDMDFNFLDKYPETFGSWIGSEQRRRYLYDSGRWANVMYDPITSVEADYRRGLNIGLKPQYKR